MKLLDLLLPREVAFFKYLKDQTSNFNDACLVFEKIVSEERHQERIHLIHKLRGLEKKGDKIERFVIDKLNLTFITPIDRDDIHSIVLKIDAALDDLNSAAQKIEMYGIKKLPPRVAKFSKIIKEAGKEISHLIDCLEKKKALQHVQEITDKVHKLENESDDLFHVSMMELFNNKDPILIIKLKEVYETLEETVDSLDLVAKLVRGIVIKQG
jgi:uncharacterized protein Yka (UPF0111/DUF47 family)